MSNLKTKIDQGILYISEDGGCTWSVVGQVVPEGQASTVPGPAGAPGADGRNGINGSDGEDGFTPYINASGYWVTKIDGEEVVTGYKASGTVYTVQAATAATINVPGTPAVIQSIDNVNGIVTLTFDHLKGDKGDTPVITAETVYDDIDPTEVVGYKLYADSVLLCQINNGTDNSAYTGINPVTVDNVNKQIGLKVDTGLAVDSSTGKLKPALTTETLNSAAAIKDSQEMGNRLYATELDKNGKLSTKVPWADTKNTAGATDTTNKLFFVGAYTQTDNPQTYSNSGVHATNGEFHLDKNINHTKTSYSVTSETSSITVDFDYMFAHKYIEVDAETEGHFEINLIKSTHAFDGVKTFIIKCSIGLFGSSYQLGVKFTRASAVADQVKWTNYFDSAIISGSYYSLDEGESLELEVTFWGVNDITINGVTNHTP